MVFLFFFHGISILLSLVILVGVSECCKRYYGGTRLAFWVTLPAQLAFYAFASDYVWSHPGAAIIGVGLQAFLIVCSAVFGLVIYPVLFACIVRPDRWKVFLRWLFGFYAFTVLAFFTPTLITLMGVGQNTDFHGLVVDMTQLPAGYYILHVNDLRVVKVIRIQKD